MAKLKQEQGTSYLVHSVILCLVYHADTYTHLARILNRAVCVAEPDVFHAHLAKGLRPQFPDYPCTALPSDVPTRQQLLYLLVRSYASQAAYLKPPVLSPPEAWCFVSVVLTWLFTFAILLPPLRRRLSARIQVAWLFTNMANDLFTPSFCWGIMHTAPPSCIYHYTPVMCEALGYTVLVGLPPWFIYSVAVIVTASLSIITTLLVRHGLADEVPYKLPSLWVRHIITLAAVLAFTAFRGQIWRRLLRPMAQMGWFKRAPLSGVTQALMDSQGKALVMPPRPPPPAMQLMMSPQSRWVSWCWLPWTTCSRRGAAVKQFPSRESFSHVPPPAMATVLQGQRDLEPPEEVSPSPVIREGFAGEARELATPLRRRGCSSSQQLFHQQQSERLEEHGLRTPLVARGGTNEGSSNDDVNTFKSRSSAWLALCGRRVDGDWRRAGSDGEGGSGISGRSGGNMWGPQQLLSKSVASEVQSRGCCEGKQQLRQLPPALRQPPLEPQPRLQLRSRVLPEEAVGVATSGLDPSRLAHPHGALPSAEPPVRPVCAGSQEYRMNSLQQLHLDPEPSGLFRRLADATSSGDATAHSCGEVNRVGTTSEHLGAYLATLRSADQLSRSPPSSSTAANSTRADAWSPPSQYGPSTVRPGSMSFTDPPAFFGSSSEPPPPATESKPAPITIDRLRAIVAAARAAPYCPNPRVHLTRLHLCLPGMATAELPAGWREEMLRQLSRTALALALASPAGRAPRGLTGPSHSAGEGHVASSGVKDV
ncbi:hypothetical protein Vretimale_8852 [Volvox reticuliferus]|uniref:Uncharacterized protein n=1 Tax=Volvox reticuliferus TaxID=1737510 RepID=A0A8J4LPD2_9CHLO|nr:hypothetical protein Vretimale_8852 [Volvox reticuliferus]